MDDRALVRRADGPTTVLAVLLGSPGSSSAVERARGRDAFGEHSATPLLAALTADPAVHGDPCDDDG